MMGNKDLKEHSDTEVSSVYSLFLHIFMNMNINLIIVFIKQSDCGPASSKVFAVVTAVGL